jgi:hypothetical protein
VTWQIIRWERVRGFAVRLSLAVLAGAVACITVLPAISLGETLLAKAHLPQPVLLFIPMGIVLALGTGPATGSLLRPRA